MKMSDKDRAIIEAERQREALENPTRRDCLAEYQLPSGAVLDMCFDQNADVGDATPLFTEALTLTDEQLIDAYGGPANILRDLADHNYHHTPQWIGFNLLVAMKGVQINYFTTMRDVLSSIRESYSGLISTGEDEDWMACPTEKLDRLIAVGVEIETIGFDATVKKHRANPNPHGFWGWRTADMAEVDVKLARAMINRQVYTANELAHRWDSDYYRDIRATPINKLPPLV